MRKIRDPIKTQDVSWRVRTSEEKYLLIKNADTVRYIKAQRISRIGHIVRMDKERRVKRITERRPVAVRRVGRPRIRWEDYVLAGLGKMKIQNWTGMVVNGEEWKTIF